MNAIRFTVTDRSTGEVITAAAPRRGEHVEKGVTKLLAPSKEACEGIKAMLRARSKLGITGGVLADG